MSNAHSPQESSDVFIYDLLIVSFPKAQYSKKMALDSWGQLDPGTRELTQWVKDLSLIQEPTQNQEQLHTWVTTSGEKQGQAHLRDFLASQYS